MNHPSSRPAADNSLHPESPGIFLPPPLLFVAGFLAGLALERWVLRLRVGGGVLRAAILLTGWALAWGALLLVSWALLTFWRRRTSVIPVRPATNLVASGPYRFSRNPMYVSLTALYLGLAFIFDLAWPLLALPLVLAGLRRLVVDREEDYLARRFGVEYSEYCRRVRRWL